MGEQVHDFFFSEEEEEQLLEAIRKAESSSSGELRVHLEDYCEGEVGDRAKVLFTGLGLNRSQERNAVLFYLAVRSHKFYVLADKAIDKKVQDGFWNEIASAMEQSFKKGDFIHGLIDGIEKVGSQFKSHFPSDGKDENQFPDDISYQKG